MKKKKILSLIVMALVVITAGLFAGCGDKYANMTIELDKEEITLLLNGTEEEKSSTFSATVSGIGEDISGKVIFEQTDSSIANFEIISFEDDVSTVKVTALLGGTTTAKIKSEEVPTRVFAEITINVVEEVTGLDYVPTLKPYVAISDPTILENIDAIKAFKPTITVLNAAEFIKFTPATTTQKGIKYTLINKYAGLMVDNATGMIYYSDDSLKLTESGEISMVGMMGHEGYATVRATSVSNPELFVEFELRIIYPIENLTTLGFNENGQAIEEMILSNGRFREGTKTWSLDFLNAQQDYNLVCWSDNELILEVEKNSATTFTIRSGIEGATTFHVKVEVVGYEQHYTMSSIPVKVVQFPEQVYFDKISYGDVAKELFVYDDYPNGLGIPLTITAGPIGAYNKNIIIQFVNELDKLKYLDASGYFNSQYLKLRYKDGSYVNVDDIIDGAENGTKIYAMSAGNYAEPLSLKFLAKWTQKNESDIINEEVYSLINFNLKVGARKITIDYPDNKFYVGENETIKLYYSLEGTAQNANVFADVIFAKLNDESVASVAEETIVLENEDLNGKYVEITGLNEGTTQIELSLSNGVKILYDINVFAHVDDFTVNIGKVEDNNGIAQLELANNNGLKSVSSATIKVNSSLKVDVAKYILKNGIYESTQSGTISSITYSISDNDDINDYASISTNGVFRTYMETPKNVQVTVSVIIKFSQLNGDGTVSLEEKQFNFIVKIYVPITSVELNTYEITLYDYDTLRYYDKYKGQLQILKNVYDEIEEELTKVLAINVYPQNATNKNIQINFSNVSALESQGNNVYRAVSSGLGTDIIPCDVEIIVQDFNIYYVKVCRIYVKFPNLSSSVSLLNIEKKTIENDSEIPYLYFDARKGLNSQNNTFQIQAKPVGAGTFGTELLNNDVIYKYINHSDDTGVNPVFNVDENGIITPLRAGVAYVDVVAKDSFINSTEYTNYKRVKVKVADGKTEITAIEINSATEFLAINTVEGLKLNYLITDTLNFALVNFVPLGLINGEILPFTGSINGAGINGNNTINSLKLVKETNEQNIIFALILNNKGTIKNLNINVTQLQLNLSSSDASSLNFGILTAVNDGTILNCKVDVINGIINTNVNVNNIGMIAGVNNENSVIDTCKVFGKLIINQGQSVLSTQKFNIGGIVGNNIGDVIGTYNFYNETLTDFNNSNANSNINIIFNKNNVSSVQHETIMQNSCFGLVAGNSVGLIDSLYASGYLKVNGYSNVGGIVGMAKNLTIQNCYFNGSVFGLNNVGGIAGKATSSEFKNDIVEMLDQNSENIYAGVKGENCVGGLVGETNNSTINGCFTKSYVSKNVGENFEGAVVAEFSATAENQQIYVGGLIGKMNLTIVDICYSQVNISMILKHGKVNENIVFAQGYVGGISGYMHNQFETNFGGKINNSYAMGSVNVKCFDADANIIANPTNVIVGGIVGKYDIKNNQGSFANTYNAIAENIIGLNETVENPDEINKCNYTSLTAKENIVFSALANNDCWSVNNALNNGYPYLTFNTNKMLVIVPESLSINIKNSSIVKSEDLLKQNKHIKIDNSKLVLFYHSSEKLNYLNNFELNKLINVVFEPNSVNRSSLIFEISNVSVLTKLSTGEFKILGTGITGITIISKYNLQALATITIEIIDATTNIKLFALSDFSGNEIETIDAMKNDKVQIYYQISGSQNVMLEYVVENESEKQIISIVGAEWQGDKNFVEILATKTQMINCLENTTGINLKVKPFIYVVDSLGIATKQYLPFEKRIIIKISLGTQSVQITPEQAEISLKDISTFSIKTISDLPITDVEPEIKVELVGKDSQGVTIYTDATNLVDLTLKALDVSGKNFNVSLKIKESEKNNQMFLTQQVIRVTVSVLKSHSINVQGQIQKIEKEFYLTIKPQKISFVEMEYFSDGEQYTDENGNITFNINETAGNIIKSGTIGILKIKLFPENSMDNISKIELTSLSSKGNISFQQVLLDENKYVVLTPYPTQINGGTQLLEHSNSDLSYDGSLYVKCLIPSSIEEGTAYTLNFKCYYKNSNLTFSTNLNLYSQTPKKLELSYNESASYLNKEFLPKNSTETLTLSISKITDLSSLKIIVKDDLGNNITNGVNISSLPLTTKVKGMITTVTYSISANESLVGTNLNVYAEISEISGNKEFKYLSNVLKLMVVNEIVKNVSINNTVLENNNIILRKPYGGSYALEFNVNTSLGNNIVEQFNSFNTAKNSNGKMSYWFDSANQNLKVYFASDNLTGVNYKIHSGTKTLIEPLRVSQDKLYGIFAYCYVNGEITPFDYESENYSLINKTTGRYVVGDLIVFIYRVEFKTDFYLQGRFENPVPIYTLEEFNSMRENGNYILMNDLYLGDDFKAVETKVSSFDGNGYTLQIGGFKNIGSDLETVQETGNFGLFAQIDEGDVLKNIKVYFAKRIPTGNAGIEMNITNYKNVNFGGVVAVNNGGIVYNCEATTQNMLLKITTQTMIENQVVATNIAPIVAINNGFVTHSRTYNINITVSKGYVGGLVAQNNGVISNSYVKSSIIVHEASTDTSTLQSTSLLGGLVAINIGRVFGSYVDCYDNAVALSFNGLIGGFCVINEGTIENCYSNVKMQSQVKTAGFAYSSQKGTIKNSYSISYSPTSSASRAPFVGVDGTNVLGSSSNLTNCYYLQTTDSIFPTYSNYPAKKLVKNDARNELAIEYNLNGFVFRGENGTWIMDTNRPELVEANKIAISQQKLLSRTNDPETDEIIYTYIDKDTENYLSGTINNPIIITNAKQFVNYILKNNGNTFGSTYTNSNYYRLVCDIDLSEFVINSEYGADTYETILAGGLEGNACKITGIRLSAPRNIANINNVGLFSRLQNAVVKNLTLSPVQVYANNIKNVGVLAGTISGNSVITNIKIDAESVVVQGKNYVGGVAGCIIDTSIAENINSNISVNASFKENSSLVDNYSSSTNSGYSGSVFGVVDLASVNRNLKAPIYNISVNGDVKVFGQFAGMAYGLVAKKSFVDLTSVVVKNKSFVKATFSAGGIAGENRGYISRASIENEKQSLIDNRSDLTKTTDDQNINFFEGYPVIIGGLIGFNNGGMIDNCYSKMDVRNINSSYAGGLIGLVNGGNFYSSYSTSSVLSGQYVGGLFGVISNYDTLVAPVDTTGTKLLFKNTSSNNVTINSAVNIINCIALNNWLTTIDLNNLNTATKGMIFAIFEDGNSIMINAQDNYYLKTSFEIGSSFADAVDAYGISIDQKNINNNVAFKYFSSGIWDNANNLTFKLPSLKQVNALNLQPISLINISKKEISNLAELVYIGAGNYTLIDNIYAFGIDISINNFTGILDGNGYSIVGVTKTSKDASIGLFKSTNGATIKNLGLVGINYQLELGTAGLGSTKIGGLIGVANNTTISTSFVDGNINILSGSMANIGGMAGQLNNSKITNCYNQVNIITYQVSNVQIASFAGSLADESVNLIENVYYAGKQYISDNSIQTTFKEIMFKCDEDTGTCTVTNAQTFNLKTFETFDVDYKNVWAIDYRTGKKGLPILRIDNENNKSTINDGIVILVKNSLNDEIINSQFINANQNYSLKITKPAEVSYYNIKMNDKVLAILSGNTEQTHIINFGIASGEISTINMFNTIYTIVIEMGEVEYSLQKSVFNNGNIEQKATEQISSTKILTKESLNEWFSSSTICPEGYEFVGARVKSEDAYVLIVTDNRYSKNIRNQWEQNDDGTHLLYNENYYKILPENRYTKSNNEYIANVEGGYLKITTFGQNIYGIENNFGPITKNTELVGFYQLKTFTVIFYMPEQVSKITVNNEIIEIPESRIITINCGYGGNLGEVKIIYSGLYQFNGWYYADENGNITLNEYTNNGEELFSTIKESIALIPKLTLKN